MKLSLWMMIRCVGLTTGEFHIKACRADVLGQNIAGFPLSNDPLESLQIWGRTLKA